MFRLWALVLCCHLILPFSVTALRDSVPRFFAIGIFYGPPLELTNDNQFKWISEANVDFIQYIEDSLRKDVASAQKRNFEILELAAKHKLRYFVNDPRARSTEADIIQMVNVYKSHPAVAGYFIVDEPGKGGLQGPATAYKTVLKYDPARFPSVNLLPNFVYPDYEQAYVEDWVQQVGKENLKLLSFDHYPLLANGNFGPAYFSNLEIFRRIGLKYGITTSTYPQSMGIKNAYRRPDSSELRYSAYTALAYGVKNLVWFTYNTPVRQPAERFTSAIIDSLGNKTDLYEPFKNLNAELQQLGKTLGKLDAVAVYHSDTLDGTSAFTIPKDFFLKPVGGNNRVIISDFKDPKTQQHYVMIVNKGLRNAATILFDIDKKVKQLRYISVKDGGQHQTNYKAGKPFTDLFLPGEGKLYAIEGKLR